MPSQFTEPRATSQPGTPSVAGSPPAGRSESPQDLPHGLITPPECVRAVVARERAKPAPILFLEEAWTRMTEELTLQHCFEDAGHEVLYRSTPEGPEVLAVGFDEIQAFVKNLSLDEQMKFQTWTP